MTIDEAIKHAKDQQEIFGGKHKEFLTNVAEWLEELKNLKPSKKGFITIGQTVEDFEKEIRAKAIDEFKDLKEKNVAKKPLPKGTHKGIDNFYCPNCNHPLTNRHEQCELPYCDICGQKLDWE